MTFDSRQLSFIIISIGIRPRHRHRHHHSSPSSLSSSLSPSSFFLCIIFSSPPSYFLSGHAVVWCFYPCASAVSFFKAKLPVLLLEQAFKLCSILLFNVLGTLPGQLFLDTWLDTCLSEPCLRTCSWVPILRNRLFGALPDSLFLGTFSSEPVLGNFAC